MVASRILNLRDSALRSSLVSDEFTFDKISATGGCQMFIRILNLRDSALRSSLVSDEFTFDKISATGGCQMFILPL